MYFSTVYIPYFSMLGLTDSPGMHLGKSALDCMPTWHGSLCTVKKIMINFKLNLFVLYCMIKSVSGPTHCSILFINLLTNNFDSALHCVYDVPPSVTPSPTSESLDI
jgi:hypothetical protein